MLKIYIEQNGILYNILIVQYSGRLNIDLHNQILENKQKILDQRCHA